MLLELRGRDASWHQQRLMRLYTLILRCHSWGLKRINFERPRATRLRMGAASVVAKRGRWKALEGQILGSHHRIKLSVLGALGLVIPWPRVRQARASRQPFLRLLTPTSLTASAR